MRNFFVIIFLFFLTRVYSNSPEWIKGPQKFCSANEICVLGTGKTLEKATSAARDELAKTLKVKIKGTTSFNSFSSQTRQDEVVVGDIKENFNQDIEEISDEILEGSFSKETYSSNNNYFVLLGLDKQKSAQIIKNKIIFLDENIEHLYQLGKRAPLFEAIKIYSIREDLNSRYEFFTGEKISPKIALKDLYAIKEKFFKRETKVLFKFINFKDEEELKNFITSKFLDLGLVQVIDPNERNINTLKIYFDFKKAHLNVEGFEKFQFNFAAYSYNPNNIKIGMIIFSTEGIGRDFLHAKEIAKKKIKHYLIDNINQMNID